MNNIFKYLVILIDRKHTRLFTIENGTVGAREEFESNDVPQKVKHGDDTWDAQDKINRHIEEHLHRHLVKTNERIEEFAKINKQIDRIIIGGHKQLFSKIKKHLKYPLSKKVKGTFVTELKGPFGEILKRTKHSIAEIESSVAP